MANSSVGGSAVRTVAWVGLKIVIPLAVAFSVTVVLLLFSSGPLAVAGIGGLLVLWGMRQDATLYTEQFADWYSPAVSGIDAARRVVRLGLFYSLIPVAVALGEWISAELRLGVPVVGAVLVGWPTWMWVRRRVNQPPPRQFQPTVEHVRGGKLISKTEAAERARQLTGEETQPIFFGGLPLPRRQANLHFLVTGATGSGKTITLRMLMQSTLPGIRPGSDSRTLIYDAKEDLLPILKGMGLSCPIHILNPYDARCAAWDIACDVVDQESAQAMVNVLIPEPQGERQRFFTESSRALLFELILTFMSCCGTNWTLRDLLVASKFKWMRGVLALTDRGRDKFEEYCRKKDTYSEIRMTMANALLPYETIAALWDKPYRLDRRVSLAKWITEESILLLGRNRSKSSALCEINRALFDRASELLLAQPDSGSRQTWILLDELPKMGRLDGLDDLLSMGRSRAVSVALGFQDVEQLRDIRKLYGEHQTHAMLGQCGNRAFLRLESPEICEWASRWFHEREVLDVYEGYSRGENRNEQGGRTTTEGRDQRAQMAERRLVLPSEFDLPPPSQKNGLWGYYQIRGVGSYKCDYKAELADVDRRTLQFEKRDPADQMLRDWTDEDLRRLGLEQVQPEAEPTVNEPPPPTPTEPTDPPPVAGQTGMEGLERVRARRRR